MPAIPLRADWDAVRVRDAARLVDAAGQARRLLAIAAVYDGMSRAAAARLGGMDRQTLRDWVHRFNATGPSGLVDRKAPGAAPRLTSDQEAEFAAREKGYTFVSHQQEVGAGYFDDVTTVIQGGSSSVTALKGSTEEEQFYEKEKAA